MKNRRPPAQRVERRRALVNLNLAGDPRPRAGVGRAGCASILSRLVVLAAIVAAAAVLR